MEGLIKWSKFFFKKNRSHGGVVNTAVAIAVADALVERHPKLSCKFWTCTWARSLFYCIEFVRRAGMTRKVEIPAGAKKEVELTLLHEIVNNVEIFHIPSSLVLNLDQTNWKYISVGKTAKVKKGSNSISISGLSDKKSMSATFTIILNGKFLPMQLIYGGRTKQSLPKSESPVGLFSVC